MKRNRALQFRAAALLVLFVLSFCANYLFIHTHSLGNGEFVAHSHLCNVNSTHSHSADDIDAIALSNAIMHSMEKTSVEFAPIAPSTCVKLLQAPISKLHSIHASASSSRAPPCVLFI